MAYADDSSPAALTCLVTSSKARRGKRCSWLRARLFLVWFLAENDGGDSGGEQ